MDQYNVVPLRQNGDYGKVTIPGSKSITNRAICLAAFAYGESLLEDILLSDDTINCLESIKSIGAKANLCEEKKTVSIIGIGNQFPSEAQCYVGSAGTAARFLTAMLSMLPGAYEISASKQMQSRPMNDLLVVLEESGVRFDYLGNDRSLPLIKRRGMLQATRLKVNCEKSSQFLSGLLLAACLSKKDMEIEVASELVAKSYVDITLNVMRNFGIVVENVGYKLFKIPGGQHIKAITFQVEPDVSSACYFFSIPAMLGGKIKVNAVSLASIQGDTQFLKVLTDIGCNVIPDDTGIVVYNKNERISGIEVDMNDFSDQVITLAVLGTHAASPVSIKNIGHIQYQESNRITACISELRKLGIIVKEEHNGFTVFPGNIIPGKVETYGDHRMAMAFTLIGLRNQGITIIDPLCCRKTFPNYFTVLEGLYV